MNFPGVRATGGSGGGDLAAGMSDQEAKLVKAVSCCDDDITLSKS